MLRLVAVLGAAACLLVLSGVAAPSSAQAFLGESLVVESVSGVKTLTSGARSFLENPSNVKVLLEEASADGAASEGAAATVAEGSGLVPVLAPLAALGVGVGVGSKICGWLGIEGCWFAENTEVQPSVTQANETSWRFYREAPALTNMAQSWKGPPLVPYTYYLTGTAFGTHVENVGVVGHGDYPADCSPARAAASGATLFLESGPTGSFCTSPTLGKVVFETTVQGRSGLEGKRFGFASPSTVAALPEASIANTYCQYGGSCSSSTPSDWPHKAAELLTGSNSGVGAVGQHLAHGLGAAVADPYATEGVVPNCGGLTYEQCASLLEGQGLEAVKNTLGWQTAALGTAADRVAQTQPSAGSHLAVKASVVVDVNPSAAAMPVLVPEWEDHETYQHYAARLPGALVPHRQEVGEANEDAQAGPEAVLSTSPQPGSRADPSGQTDVNVRTNPATAPAPGTGAGTCSATVGAIDWTPLNKPLGTKFPFGVFAFFTGWLSSWESGEAEPPDWTVTLLPAGVFGSPEGLHVHINLGFMGPVVSVARVVFLFAAFVGLLWFLATAAAKLQGDAS